MMFLRVIDHVDITRWQRQTHIDPCEAPGFQFFADLIVKYTGDRFLNKRNTALAEPFTTVDVGIGYRFGQYEIRVDGRNLSDRRDPVAESELGDAQYYRLFARALKASMGVRF